MIAELSPIKILMKGFHIMEPMPMENFLLADGNSHEMKLFMNSRMCGTNQEKDIGHKKIV